MKKLVIHYLDPLLMLSANSSWELKCSWLHWLMVSAWALDQGSVPLLVLLDFSVTSDPIKRGIIVEYLTDVGLEDTILWWFWSLSLI